MAESATHSWLLPLLSSWVYPSMKAIHRPLGMEAEGWLTIQIRHTKLPPSFALAKEPNLFSAPYSNSPSNPVAMTNFANIGSLSHSGIIDTQEALVPVYIALVTASTSLIRNAFHVISGNNSGRCRILNCKGIDRLCENAVSRLMCCTSLK